jgi:hypothetical protein
MTGKKSFQKLAAVLFLVSGAFIAGCETTESDTVVSGGVAYGTTFYDPWYYGDYDYPPDVIVTPPPERPVSPPTPTHPIYSPPGPSVSPMPSIPTTPRPAFRR